MTQWFTITRKQHNALFPTRKVDWRSYYTYEYMNNEVEADCLYLYKYPTLLFTLAMTVLAPFLCFIYGYKDVQLFLKSLWYCDMLGGDYVANISTTNHKMFLTVAKEIKN